MLTMNLFLLLFHLLSKQKKGGGGTEVRVGVCLHVLVVYT